MPSLKPTTPPVAPLSALGDRLGDRIKHLDALLGLIRPVPSEWLKTPSRASSGVSSGVSGGSTGGLIPCGKYRELIGAWRKALKWTEGLDRALSAMLAAVVSTKSVGDQLWLKIIGPAGCGKSTLCEALSTNPKYVVAKSTIRGFHSGWRSDGGEDNSLIELVRDKTLVTKDGDTLLQSPNLGQILSEARDLYDSTSRAHYRNALGKDYTGVRMTWLLCGTSSLRQIDSSELGERFLDCVIMDSIDDDLEDDILWRVVNRAERNLALESDGKLETQYDPELSKAMLMTGGYIDYLRQGAAELLSQVHSSEEVLRRCTRLGKFTAFMRARPSKKQDENSEREFAARLVSQLIRLAKCQAVVLNRKAIDQEVMDRVERIAMDTSRGITLQIVEHLYDYPQGRERSAIAMYINRPNDQVYHLLRFLRQIGVLQINLVATASGMKTKQQLHTLTDRVRKLYSEVRPNAQDT